MTKVRFPPRTSLFANFMGTLYIFILRYRPEFATNKPGDIEMAREMKERARRPNRLMQMVEKGKLSSLGHGWRSNLDTVIPNFPQLSMDDLRSITLGVYQIKQAKKYTDEHMMENGDYQVRCSMFWCLCEKTLVNFYKKLML